MNEAYLKKLLARLIGLKKQLHIGSQYEFLDQFASIYQGIEICVLIGVHWTKIVKKKFGKLIIKANEGIGEYYIVDTEHSSEDFNALFQHYRFPIAKMTKLELKKKYIDWRYEDIMEHTGFVYPYWRKAMWKMQSL